MIIEPRGDRIGWIDAEDLYLNPAAAYRVADAVAGANGDHLGLTRRTLNKRLFERGLLASAERDRGKLTVRRTLEGSRRDVLHLKATTIMPAGNRDADQGLFPSGRKS